MNSNDITWQLANDQCLDLVSHFFKGFGHATLRNVLQNTDIKVIQDELEFIGAGISNTKTVTTIYPLEKSRTLQKILFNPRLLEILTKVLSPFWYYGSDSFIGHNFPPHRDTFFNPPFFKALMPLIPCVFSVIPGSHCYGDTFACEVGKLATDWDSGSLKRCMKEISFNSDSKIVSHFNWLRPDELFTNINLNPGDIFLFSQNIVHALTASSGKNFFINLTLIPSSCASKQYGLTRTEHLEKVISNIAAICACEYQLSAIKGLAADDCIFQGYKFSKEDMTALTSAGSWNDCFGLGLISKERWLEAFKAVSYKGFQSIQDIL